MDLVKILKNMPRDTKLYSPAFGEVKFKSIYNGKVLTKDSANIERVFYSNGNFYEVGECMLFPSKENRDWAKFNICPFKDGDVISKVYSDGTKYIAIFSHVGGVTPETLYYHCYATISGRIKIGKDYGIGVYTEYKLASEKDKEFLFKKLLEEGYYWESFTNSLKPIYLKFKVGDTISRKDYPNHTIVSIEKDRYRLEKGLFLLFINQEEWKVAKFDVNTLKPFDKVLVRDEDNNEWCCAFYSHYREESYYRFCCASSAYLQCVPYNEDTKHLVGTTDNCPEYYKTWKE